MIPLRPRHQRVTSCSSQALELKNKPAPITTTSKSVVFSFSWDGMATAWLWNGPSVFCWIERGREILCQSSHLLGNMVGHQRATPCTEWRPSCCVFGSFVGEDSRQASRVCTGSSRAALLLDLSRGLRPCRRVLPPPRRIYRICCAGYLSISPLWPPLSVTGVAFCNKQRHGPRKRRCGGRVSM